MTLKVLKDKLDAQPFEPFRLRMPDGRALRVPHPEFVSKSPRDRIVIVRWDNGERFHVVDLDLVSDLEPDPNKGAPRKKFQTLTVSADCSTTFKQVATAV